MLVYCANTCLSIGKFAVFCYVVFIFIFCLRPKCAKSGRHSWELWNVNFCLRVYPPFYLRIYLTLTGVWLLVTFVIPRLLLSVSFYIVSKCMPERERERELWSTMISDFSGSCFYR